LDERSGVSFVDDSPERISAPDFLGDFVKPVIFERLLLRVET